MNAPLNNMDNDITFFGMLFGPKYHLLIEALEYARLWSLYNSFGSLTNVSTSTHERKMKDLKSIDMFARSRVLAPSA